MRDITQTAQDYIDKGWPVVPIRPGTKKGPKDWQKTTFTANDFQPDDGIALRCDQLMCVDCEDPFTTALAHRLLPDTGLMHGRPNNPDSHLWYARHPDATTTSFKDTTLDATGKHKTIVELLTGNGHYVLVPPTVHPSGEVITFNGHDGDPATLTDYAPFLEGLTDVAIGGLVLRHWPEFTHDAMGPLVGLLLHAKFDSHRVMRLITAIGQVGPAVPYAKEMLDFCRTTIGKFVASSKTTGAPALEKMVGKDLVQQLRSFVKTDVILDDWIEKLNAHHFIVSVGSTVVVADDSDPNGIVLWSFSEFKKNRCKDFLPSKEGKRGRPVADAWIEHPRGHKFDRLLYAPPGSVITPGPKDYNGWKDFVVDEGTPSEKFLWPRIQYHLLEVICDGDLMLYRWVLNWCAALVQRPGAHAVTALVLQGGQGAGKGTFAEDILGGMFDTRHFITIDDPQQFYGRFTNLLSGRCLVYLDEATWGGDKRSAGILKGRITGHHLTVEHKHIASYQEPSMLHIIFGSNEDWPVGIDRDDRRFACLRVVNPRANDPTYFDPLYAEIKGRGRAAFLDYLLRWSIREPWLRLPPKTRSKDDLKRLSRKPHEVWWVERLSDGCFEPTRGWPKTVIKSALHQRFVTDMQALGERRLPSDQLSVVLLKMCPSLTSGREKRGAPRVWKLPTLNVARAEMIKYLNVEVDWEDWVPPTIRGPLLP
jgi:hypothetical protein